jgi:internalin A
LAKVTKLELSYNQITDASLKEVAKLKNLAELYLGRTQVTDAGIAELKKALPKCRVFSR